MDLLERRITRGSNSLDCRVNVFGIAAYCNYRWTAGETSSEIGRRVLPLTGAAGISSSPGVASTRRRQEGVSGVAAKSNPFGIARKTTFEIVTALFDGGAENFRSRRNSNNVGSPKRLWGSVHSITFW